MVITAGESTRGETCGDLAQATGDASRVVLPQWTLAIRN